MLLVLVMLVAVPRLMVMWVLRLVAVVVRLVWLM